MLISYYRHELHTSLNAIIGYSELLLEDAQSSSLVEVERGLGEILEACRALLAFAKELLSPSRLRELSTDALTLLTQQMHAAGQEPLGKVLANCATLIAAAEHAGLYAIIPDLCKIQASGSMLQNLLDTHNSTLAVSAVRSQRVAAEEDGEGEGEEPGPVAAGNEKILIIDDNSMNRDLLRQWLERRGYRVEEATGGRQGLEFIAEQAYDLVLLDLRMPDLSGLELLKALKEQGRLPQLSVVILSASDELKDVASCLEHGALDYLVKPLNLAILGVRIRTYMERQRQHQREQQQLHELQWQKEAAVAAPLLELPAGVAPRLPQGRGAGVALFPAVTLLWAEFGDCARLYQEHSADALIAHLNQVSALCDALCARHAVTRIDSPLFACIAVAGLSATAPDSAAAITALAVALGEELERLNARNGLPLSLHIGVHSGPVLAGVLDAARPAYGVWGETCSIVRRLSAAAPAGEVYISAAAQGQLGETFRGAECRLQEPTGESLRVYRLQRPAASAGSPQG